MDNFEVFRNRIDTYIQDRMDASQRLSFEKVLADQPELKAEVDLQQSYHDSFKRKDLLDFKMKLEEIADAHEVSRTDAQATKIAFFRNPYFLAAAAICLLFASILALVNYRQHSHTYLPYAEVVVPFISNNSSHTRAEMDGVDSLFFYFETQINTKNAEQSQLLTLIEAMEKTSSIEDYQQRYQQATDVLLARGYLEYGHPEKTLNILNRHWQVDNTTCSINFYRAVALLELGRNREAEKILTGLKCTAIQQEVAELLKISKTNQSK